MNCSDIRALLTAHTDGELDATDSLHMETRLGSYVTCISIATNRDGVVQTLRQGPHVPGLYMKAPIGLSEWVMRAVQVETGV